MNAQRKNQSDGTIELTLTVPWADVSKTYDHVVDEAVANTEIQGFRKGKAPRKLVEEKLDKTKLYEEVLKHLIPDVYNKALTQEGIKPIVNPKIELVEATEGKDWVIKAYTAQKPTVTLGNYKKAIADLKASKTKKLWVPGKDEKPDKEEKPEDKKPTLDELLKALYDNTTVTLPSMLIEHEVNRLLSDLIDQTKRLGLSVEQYLSSTNRTSESVRKEYEQQAKRTLTLEFALEEVADSEGVIVADDDIEAVIKTAKTDEEKTALASQKYYLASVLRRQKTIDFLAAL